MGFVYSLLYYRPHVRDLLQTYKTHSKQILFIVLVGIYPKYLLKYWSIQHLSLAHIACVYHATPAVTVLVSYIVQGKSISYMQGLGVGISFLGIVLCTEYTHDPFVINYPLICLLGAVVAHSISILFTQEMVCSLISLSEVLIITLFLTAVLSCLTVMIGSVAVQYDNISVNWILFCMLGFMGFKTVVYHYYHYWALSCYSAVWISLIEYLGPLMSCGYGYWFMGEMITGWQIIGAVITCIGMYIFYQGDDKKQYSFS